MASAPTTSLICILDTDEEIYAQILSVLCSRVATEEEVLNLLKSGDITALCRLALQEAVEDYETELKKLTSDGTEPETDGDKTNNNASLESLWKNFDGALTVVFWLLLRIPQREHQVEVVQEICQRFAYLCNLVTKESISTFDPLTLNWQSFVSFEKSFPFAIGYLSNGAERTKLAGKHCTLILCNLYNCLNIEDPLKYQILLTILVLTNRTGNLMAIKSLLNPNIVRAAKYTPQKSSITLKDACRIIWLLSAYSLQSLSKEAQVDKETSGNMDNDSPKNYRKLAGEFFTKFASSFRGTEASNDALSAHVEVLCKSILANPLDFYNIQSDNKAVNHQSSSLGSRGLVGLGSGTGLGSSTLLKLSLTSIVKLPAIVETLKGETVTNGSTLYRLLQIIASEDLSAYRAFEKTAPGVTEKIFMILESAHSSEKQFISNIRLLSLARLCGGVYNGNDVSTASSSSLVSGGSTSGEMSTDESNGDATRSTSGSRVVSYTAIADMLQLVVGPSEVCSENFGSFSDENASRSVDEQVEEWVVEAVLNGLIEAQLNQMDGTVSVLQSVCSFAKPNWNVMREKLSQWDTNMEKLRRQSLAAAEAATQQERQRAVRNNRTKCKFFTKFISHEIHFSPNSNLLNSDVSNTNTASNFRQSQDKSGGKPNTLGQNANTMGGQETSQPPPFGGYAHQDQNWRGQTQMSNQSAADQRW
eukprot:g3136.t1